MRDIIITATADVSALLNAMRTAGRSVMDMSGQVASGGNAAAKATDSFVGRMMSRLQSLGGNVIAGAVGGIAAAATAALGGAVAKGFDTAKSAVIDFNSTLQNADIGFTTMLGSGEKSKAFLGQLQSFAKSTPFEFEGLVKNSQNLLGMGVGAKSIIPTLTALGDSVASVGGSGEQLNGVITAFGQTMAKGNLDMGNMQQMLEGGVPNALKILASSYGVTTGEMVKMISSGKVMSADALPRLVKGIEQGTASTAALGGMMDKQSQTFSGAMSNIADAVTQTTAGAFKPLFDEVSRNAQGLATFLGSDQVSTFAKRFSTGLQGVITRFDEFKPKVKEALGGVPKVLGEIVDKVKPVADGISKAFSGSGGDLAKDALTIIRSLSPLGAVLTGLAPTIVPLANEAASLAKILGGALSGAVSTLAPVLVTLLGAVVGIITPLAQIPGLAQGIVLGLIAWKAASMGMAAVNAVIAGYTAFTYGAAGATYASGAAAKIYAVLTNGVSIATKTAAAGQWLLNAAMSANPIGIIIVAITALVAGLVWFFSQTKVGQDIWAGFVGFLTDAWNGFVGWIGGALKAVGAFFVQWGPMILAAVLPIIGIPLLIISHWGEIVAFFQALPGKVMGFLAGAAKWLVDTGSKIIAGMVAGVTTGWSAMTTWLGALPGKVLAGVTGAAKWLVETGSKILDGLISGAKAGLLAFGRWELSIGRAVLDGVSGAAKWLVDTGHDILDGLISGGKAGLLAFGKWEIGIGKAVIGWLKGAGQWLVDTGSDILHGLASGAQAGWSAVTKFLGSIPGKVRAGISGASTMLVTIGRQIVDGLVSGVSGGIGRVIAAARSLANALPEWARKVLGIASPSKVFREIGRWVGVGLVKGLEGTADQVQSTMESLTSKVTSAFDKLADQREASQKRLKALDKSLAGTSTKTDAGRKRAADIRAQIADEKAELASINKAGNLGKGGKSALLAALERDTKDLAALAARRDALGEDLKTAQSNLDAAISKRDDYASSTRQSAIDGGSAQNTYSKALQDQSDAVSKAADLATKISDLDSQVGSAGDDRQTIVDKISTLMGSANEAKTAASRASALNQVATLTNQLGDLDAKVAGYVSKRADLSSQMAAANSTAAKSPVQLMVDNLRQQVADTNEFNGLLATLKSKGLDDTTYAQIAGAGVQQGLSTARALAADGSGAVGQIHDLQGQLDTAATALGASTSKSLYQAGVDSAQAAKQGIEDQITAVSGAMGAVELAVAQSVARLGINTSALANSAGQQISAALALGSQTRKDAVGPAMDDVSKSAQDAISKLGLDGKKSAKQAGHDIIHGLKKGMKDKAVFDDLFDGMSDRMIASLRRSLGIKSPSRRFRDEVGVYIPAGIVDGVEAGARDVERSVSNLVAVPNAQSGFQGSWSASGASGAQGGGGGATVHNEFTIEVPTGAERDDVEYAENLLGQVRFAVGSTTGSM